MQFILSGLDDGSEIVLPMNPQKIDVTEGARGTTFDVLEIGTIAFARGTQPVKISWSGLLPGFSRQRDISMLQATWQEPEWVLQNFQMWLNYNRLVALMVTETQVYWDLLQVTGLTHSRGGGYGDIEYSIELTEVKPLIVRLDGELLSLVDAEGNPVESASALDGGNSPTVRTPGQVTVRVGDTIWSIAKQTTGNGRNAMALYNANRTAIGPDPFTVQPGVQIRVPQQVRQ